MVFKIFIFVGLSVYNITIAQHIYDYLNHKPTVYINEKIMSYTTLYYHIVIRTKYGHHTIPEEYEEGLYKYINGYVKNNKSVLCKINGTSNHLHLLVSLHATVCLSDFVRDLKTSTNKWMKAHGGFPDFTSWGVMYAAFTCGQSDVDLITNYIDKQKEHHRKNTFEDEYRKLIVDSGIEIDEKYFLKDDD